MRSIFLLFCAVMTGCCCQESPVAPDRPKDAPKGTPAAFAGWPLFVGTPARNMANPTAKNIPAEFTPADKDLVRWSVELGTKSHAGPVVAGGKVFIGTNNANPRGGDKG